MLSENPHSVAFLREVGTAIRTLRRGKGLTQGELAIQIHMSDATVSQVENGINQLHLPLLIDIARALEVSPYRLLWDAQKAMGLPPKLEKAEPAIEGAMEVLDKFAGFQAGREAMGPHTAAVSLRGGAKRGRSQG